MIGFNLLFEGFQSCFFFCLNAQPLFLCCLFSCDAFLLGFPLSKRAAYFIFQRIETLTSNAAAFVDLLWKCLQLSDKVFTGVVDVRF